MAPANEVFAVARGDSVPAVDGVTWVRQDLSRPLDEDALPSALDAVVHLAQSERYRDWPDGAEDIFDVNVQSTFRLLRYARRAGAGRFVLASTGGVYAPRPEPIGEDAPLACPGPYFRSKRMAELLLDDYAGELRGVVLRLFFVYGPGPGQTLVPRLAERLLADEEIAIEGDPGMRMNPIYVDDAAGALEAALELDRGEVINVGGGEVVSITDLVRRLGVALGREPRIRHTGSSGGDMVADVSRMRELLGAGEKMKLDDGLRAVASSLVGQPG
jgi:nucleoside-diphosphate-sugar epimerase